jgi:copper(I)-binding protein
MPQRGAAEPLATLWIGPAPGEFRGVDVNAVSGQPTRLRLFGIAVAVLCTAALSAGCAAGQHAATAQELPAIDAANGSNVGNLQLRALAIEAPATGTSYPKGSDAFLMLTIVNIGRSNDTLTGVSTPAARGWAAYPSTTAAAFEAAASTTAAAATTSSTAPTSSAPGAQTKVVIPAQTAVAFSVPNTSRVLLLSNLTSTLYTATSVKITFTFANAGSVTIAVPVQLSGSPASSIVPSGTSAG